MRKAICILMVVLISSLIPMNVSAQTSAELNSVVMSEDGTVKVTGVINEPAENQRYTIMVTKNKGDSSYTLEDIVYIDQKNTEEVTVNNGVFSFSFKSNIQNGEEYLLKIGGTDIDTPTSKNFVSSSEGSDKIIYGDVDNDGVITANDSAVLLQYVLNKNSVDSTIIESEGFQERSDVTGSGELTAEQAAYILQKVLNNSFKFPVEENN